MTGEAAKWTTYGEDFDTKKNLVMLTGGTATTARDGTKQSRDLPEA